MCLLLRLENVPDCDHFVSVPPLRNLDHFLERPDLWDLPLRHERYVGHVVHEVRLRNIRGGCMRHKFQHRSRSDMLHTFRSS